MTLRRRTGRGGPHNKDNGHANRPPFRLPAKVTHAGSRGPSRQGKKKKKSGPDQRRQPAIARTCSRRPLESTLRRHRGGRTPTTRAGGGLPASRNIERRSSPGTGTASPALRARRPLLQAPMSSYAAIAPGDGLRSELSFFIAKNNGNLTPCPCRAPNVSPAIARQVPAPPSRAGRDGPAWRFRRGGSVRRRWSGSALARFAYTAADHLH